MPTVSPARARAHIVDMRIPLTWMLSTAGAILLTLATTLWNIAAQSNKLDQLIVANAKMEKRLDDRDVRLDLLREKIMANERLIDGLQLRVSALERPAIERAAAMMNRR